MKALAFIDIEATSADPDRADIIEIAFIVKNEQEEIIDHFHSLIKPARSIPENIQELTGIRPEMVADAPEFNEVAEKVISKLRGATLVAHKADFDYQILKSKFEPLGMEFKSQTICTLKLSQNVAPGMASYSLAALCLFFGVDLKNNHRALQDAEATASLFQILSLLSGNSFFEKRNIEKNKKTYLERHRKLIEKSRSIPGIVAFKDKDGAVTRSKAVENIKAELEHKLELNVENKNLIALCHSVDIEETGSFAVAMLLQAKKEKKPRWSIYTFKNKRGEIIVKCGKVLPNKPAVLYFQKKEAALKVLGRIKKASQSRAYAYRDGKGLDKSEIIKKNSQALEEIRKLKPDLENLLIRSRFKVNGRYQYILTRDNDSFAIFNHQEIFSSSEELPREFLEFKKLRPGSTRALELSLQYIRNQRNKTDLALKVKRHS